MTLTNLPPIDFTNITNIDTLAIYVNDWTENLFGVLLLMYILYFYLSQNQFEVNSKTFTMSCILTLFFSIGFRLIGIITDTVLYANFAIVIVGIIVYMTTGND